MILITAKATVSPDNQDAFRALAETQVSNSRAEAGCADYGCYEDTMAPGTFIFVEKWKDQAALDFHFAQDYCHAFMKGARGLSKKVSALEIHHIDRTVTPD